MSMVDVCALADVPEDSSLRVFVGDQPVAVVRQEGEVFAILDICSHADVPLSEGEVEDCTIECWLHGSRFDLRTGVPLSLPATVPVPVFAVMIEGEGDSARVLVADTAVSVP